MERIIGTAGHIDHGKTALVKALTGMDTDRLPEERSRGITIDLGFAEMTAGDTHFGFIDVPGHERFVRNMLAGASGIDVLLLVVAADEGVMPQTREHFDICRLLDIQTGVVALTKSDLVDAEALDLARLDIAELTKGSFLENAAVVPVSSSRGSGVEDVKVALAVAAGRVESRSSDMVARMPIDRSFSVKGFGTVVTGTLASGRIDVNSRLEIMPTRTPVRIRGVQTHGRSAQFAHAGQRVAANLAGIDHQTVARGMTLVEAGALLPTQAVDAEVEVLKSAPKPLRSRQRVRVHLGTAEVFARLHVLNAAAEIPSGSHGLVQLRLESPAVAVAGERFIIRSYSPQVTIAGGSVIDPLAERHRAKDVKDVSEYLTALKAAPDHASSLKLMIARVGESGLPTKTIQACTGLTREAIAAAAGSLMAEKIGEGYVDAASFASLKTKIVSLLSRHHEKYPLERGLTREAVAVSFRGVSEEIVTAALRSLAAEGQVVVDVDVRLASHTSTLSPAESRFSQKLVTAYEAAGLEVPRLDDVITLAGDLPRATAEKLVRRLIDQKVLIKVTDQFYFARTAIETTVESLRGSAEETVDVAGFKKLTGVSRKYAIPLLEYFDREHITARVGDKRVVLK
jgi:selenocysteine-specific elongation factor